MPTLETKIWMAISDRIKSMSVALNVSFVMPNTVNNSPTGTYVRVAHIPNQPSRFGVSKNTSIVRMGIIHFMVMTPVNLNMAVSSELAGKIAEYFPIDDNIDYGDVRLRVEDAPYVGQSVPEGAYLETPIRVRYIALD